MAILANPVIAVPWRVVLYLIVKVFRGDWGEMSKRTTLKDVAREAGVTAATVSYVINDTPGQTIRPETRKRVLEAVAKLKYTPNAHARTLRSHSVPSVGLVLRKNLAVPRFSQMAYGIQARLEEEGYNALLLGNKLDNLGIADYASSYLAGRVAGVIFIGTENHGPDPRSLAALMEEKAPLVVFDCQVDATDYSTVDLDYRGGAQLIVARAIEKAGGHPGRLFYFRPRIDTCQETLREEGVRDACEQAGVELCVRLAPIDEKNMEAWDSRYVMAMTDEGLAVDAEFVATAATVLDELSDGDVLVSSWATWTHTFRALDSRRPGPNRKVTYVELASNGENWRAAHLYTRLPNYEAGVACADELLALVRGGAPSAKSIKLTNIIEAPVGTAPAAK